MQGDNPQRSEKIRRSRKGGPKVSGRKDNQWQLKVEGTRETKDATAAEKKSGKTYPAKKNYFSEAKGGKVACYGRGQVIRIEMGQN